jgi:hypothetical protein
VGIINIAEINRYIETLVTGLVVIDIHKYIFDGHNNSPLRVNASIT